MARSCVLDLVMKERKGVLDLDGIGESVCLVRYDTYRKGGGHEWSACAHWFVLCSPHIKQIRNQGQPSVSLLLLVYLASPWGRPPKV